MSYATYTTDALVCGAYDRNTADRSYLLFTREAGMLYADAKSVREERSKQRYALQEFSYVRISLIKGKHTWKVGSVETLHNDYSEAASREARGSVVRVYKTLRRYIRGEEAARELFDYVRGALATLRGEQSRRELTERIIEANILWQLGYVDEASLPTAVRSAVVASVLPEEEAALLETLTALIERGALNSQL